ncbi:MAG TPA: protein-disulfide reductase DsbD domain-containing protein [Chitinophagaceae bacterium]|nr:protein-disulfide reductase DsbD domain-containing protein [Chitinophagaceae bacterium]
MKKTGLLSLFFLAMILTAAQNPVSWTFTAKKMNSNTYEVHMTATMQSGWHLYSQVQPQDAIAIPTTFTINKNPLIKLNGKINEIGKLEKFRDEKLDLSAYQYAKKVDFVQVVNLKGKAKTNFSGNVEYQTCDDKKCLPPKKINFNVALN